MGKRLILSGAGLNIGLLAGKTQKSINEEDPVFIGGSSAGGLIAACWAFDVNLFTAISGIPQPERRLWFLRGNKK